MTTLKSGELAKQAGVNVETLRYYEREGFLPKPDRTESGYRLYPASEVQRVRFIKRSQELGFTLKEIKELLALRIDPGHSAGEVKELTDQKIQVIEQKIQVLQAMKTTLLELSQACPGEQGTVDTCPIIRCLDS